MKIYILTFFMFFFPIFTWSSMIGDTLTIHRYYPTIGVDYVPPVSTLVQEGTADALTSHGHILFNPEANHIYFDFMNSTGYCGTATVFDGFRFTGFSKTIVNATVAQITQMGVYSIAFGTNYVDVNLTGSCNSNSFIDVFIEFQGTAVPEMNSLALAFMVAIMGYFFRGR